MQNEQCGLCWDLKFDNRGNKTHDLKHLHVFTPFDYCAKCRESKYDSYGIPTHPKNKHDFLDTQHTQTNHKFVSGIKAMDQEKKRKQRNVLVYIGIVSFCVSTIVTLPNFFF